jgi:cytochrome c oxidase subunit 2
LSGCIPRPGGWRARAASLGPLALAGCAGSQSALDPAGRGAEQIAELFWWMAGGAAVVWLLVIGLAVYAVRVRPAEHRRRTALLVIGGGAVFPTLVLAGYLVYGLALLPELIRPAPAGSLTVSVSGEQWWWRVRYPLPDGGEVALANEVRLPVGEPVEFQLESPDVIHSFWIPALGGKTDMIPGRRTRLVLEPTETGIFRGACAEYCGTAHARMALYAVVMERDAFDRWLARQAEPAGAPTHPLAARGAQAFLASGCGACHTVRGTPAEGTVGPDLTHVGGRVSLGAGILPTEPDAFRRWVARTERVKPGVHMPAFGMLPDAELRALAAYLDGLR